MKRFKIIPLVLIALLLLTSCWDQKDLDKLMIVYGVGIDKSLEINSDSRYLITIGFPTISEEATQKKMEYSTPARSLADSYDKLQKKAYREISYDNTRVIVFGEDVASLGIIHHVDAMLREPLFPGTARFAVVEGRAVDLFDLEPPVSLFVSTFLYESIEQSSQATSAPFMTLRKFHNDYHTRGIEPVMPYITYSQEPGVIYVGCTALFRDDKLLEVIHGNHSQALMILRGEVYGGFYTARHTDNEDSLDDYLTIKLLGSKNKIEAKVIDDKITIFHKISIDSVLSEYTAYEPIFDTDRIEEFEKLVTNSLKGDITSTLNILQSTLQNDNIGYGKYVRAQLPDYFQADNWNEQFSHINIVLEVEVSIRSIGITP